MARSSTSRLLPSPLPKPNLRGIVQFYVQEGGKAHVPEGCTAHHDDALHL
jgi:hypothetical protein